jgi:hypothetical protein
VLFLTIQEASESIELRGFRLPWQLVQTAVLKSKKCRIARDAGEPTLEGVS